MPVTFRHHEGLEINRVDYRGQVSIGEVQAHAEFRAAHPAWLCYDHINVALPDSDGALLNNTALDALFDTYHALFETEKFLIKRRSAWVCLSPAAYGTLRHWVDAPRERPHTDVRLFETFEEAGRWLVLDAREIAIAASGEGFVELAHFAEPIAQRHSA